MPGSRSVWGCLGAILAFVLCLFIALGIWLSGWPNNKPPPLAMELAKRHLSEGPVNFPIDIELAKRFPLGSPEEMLRAELKREGFRLQCPNGRSRRPDDGKTVSACETNYDWHRDYVFSWTHGLICSGWVYVAWTDDGHGRIAVLHGTYSYECG